MAHMLNGKALGDYRITDLIAEFDKEYGRKDNGGWDEELAERLRAIEEELKDRGVFDWH
jgi:hypothetical protein